MLLAADMIFREYGAERMRVLRILDGPGVYADGRAADISILELPGMSTASRREGHPYPAFIVRRLNLLFPSCDGAKESATLEADKITLRVPAGGFPSFTCALGEWNLWGATGRIMTPRKIKV